MRRLFLVLALAVLFALVWWLGQQPPDPVRAADGQVTTIPATVGEDYTREPTGEHYDAAGNASADASQNCIETEDLWSDAAIQKILENIEPLLPMLAGSGDPDLELVAEIIGHQQGSPQRFDRLMEDHPHRELAFWRLLTHCERADDAGGVCAVDRLTGQAEILATGNAEVWRVLANRWYAEGDEKQALIALERAVASPQLRQYWPETIRVTDRALRSVGTLTATHRMALIWVLASQGPNKLTLVNTCRDRAAIELRWLEACTAYARRLESDGLAIFDQRIALVMQQDMATIISDENAYQAAAARLAATDKTVALIGSTDLYLITNEELFVDYLDQWLTHGESAAVDFAQAEIDRLGLRPACRNDANGA